MLIICVSNTWMYDWYLCIALHYDCLMTWNKQELKFDSRIKVHSKSSGRHADLCKISMTTVDMWPGIHWSSTRIRTSVSPIAVVGLEKRSCQTPSFRQQSGRSPSAQKRTERRRASVGCSPAMWRRHFNNCCVWYLMHKSIDPWPRPWPLKILQSTKNYSQKFA